MVVYVKNREPGLTGRVIMLPVVGKTDTYDMVRADEPSEVGTPLNRDLFMKMQGFEDSTTTFNEDGSITEVGTTGYLRTVYNANGSITETFSAYAGPRYVKNTVFNEDGSISVTVAVLHGDPEMRYSGNVYSGEA